MCVWTCVCVMRCIFRDIASSNLEYIDVTSNEIYKLYHLLVIWTQLYIHMNMNMYKIYNKWYNWCILLGVAWNISCVCVCVHVYMHIRYMLGWIVWEICWHLRVLFNVDNFFFIKTNGKCLWFSSSLMVFK